MRRTEDPPTTVYVVQYQIAAGPRAGTWDTVYGGGNQRGSFLLTREGSRDKRTDQTRPLRRVLVGEIVWTELEDDK
jgi:hypothetical protein